MCALSTAEAGVNAAVSPNHGSWLTFGPTLKTLASAKLWFKGWAKSLQLSVKSRLLNAQVVIFKLPLSI